MIELKRILFKIGKVNDLEEFQKISNGTWVGYESLPLNVPKKFKKLMKLNNSQLGRVKAPILIINATKDQYVPKSSPLKIYNTVNSTEKSIQWFESDHAILNSDIKTEMFSIIVDFLKKLEK